LSAWYEWDDNKNLRNILERGLYFELVQNFVWDKAMIVEDFPHDYGERRFRALGKIADKLYALVYTPRSGSLRVISLRRANKREENISGLYG
jgi:uncharacterized DUF497 family protein